jgi:hypothetical protein
MQKNSNLWNITIYSHAIMNNSAFKILTETLIKFRNQEYNKAEFHSALESVISLITESDLFEIRRTLESIEADLERADYFSNTADQDYSNAVERIEYLLKSLQ